jgi:hypothetical protein
MDSEKQLVIITNPSTDDIAYVNMLFDAGCTIVQDDLLENMRFGVPGVTPIEYGDTVITNFNPPVYKSVKKWWQIWKR